MTQVMPTPMTNLDNRTYYDEFSQRYDDGRDRGYHALIDELEVDALASYVRDREVLECGCGTGLILDRVHKLARRAVGIDLSDGMLAHAKRRGLDVQRASITELPFADASFDVAYSFKVLAHIEQIETAMREMARVVRPGGHVIGEFYNPRSLRYLVKAWKPPTRIGQETTDEAVFTRYDRLEDVARYLPSSVKIIDHIGIRVFTPTAYAHEVPVLASILRQLEKRAMRAPILKGLGGFMVVVAEKR